MQPFKRSMQNQQLGSASSSSNTGQIAEIFLLDVDCFDEIFDYISLRDLCSIGLTCKYLKRLAGNYFAKNYPNEEIYFMLEDNGKIVHKTSGYATNFAPFARRLNLNTFSSNGIDVFRFAASHEYKSLREISFYGSNVLSVEHFACISKMDVLARVTTIDVSHSSTDFINSLLNGILHFCANLSNLIFYHIDWDLNSDWMQKNIPKLERLEIGKWNGKYLEDYLRANPQIKKLSTWNGGTLRMIERTGLVLDELIFRVGRPVEIDKETCDEMNALHAKGHIKNIQILFDISYAAVNNLDNLKDVSCIASAVIERGCEVDHDFITRFALLVNLQKLDMNCEMTLDDAELLSKSLVNLQELCLLRNSLFVALPFARRLPKLRIINAWEQSQSIIDVVALNNDRTKLPDAKVLTIYLQDEAYRQIRWTSIDLLLDMVQIRRRIVKD